jgi:large subunit ribosomal protein L25
MHLRSERSGLLMEETILNAFERTEKPKKVRAAGFIPGVLSDDSLSKVTSVQFSAADLNKILTKHGSSAKLWVKYGPDKKFGFINEVQRNPVGGTVIHVDIRLLAQDQEVKMQVPLTFHGRNNLEQKRLLLQVLKSETEVSGKINLIPNNITVDVSEKEQGDTVTLKDLDLNPELKVLDREDEVYASVTALKEQVVDEPEESEKSEQTEASAESKESEEPQTE